MRVAPCPIDSITTAHDLPYMHYDDSRVMQLNLRKYILRTQSLLGSLDTLESMATLITLFSAFLEDDNSFHVPTVRIREVGLETGAHPKKFHVSLRWNVRGNFS